MSLLHSIFLSVFAAEIVDWIVFFGGDLIEQ